MTIQGFKGFNEALQCQGFQYAVGQTYAIDKKPVRCTENGFHFCEFPFDVWGYYSPALSRFCAVTGDGAVDYGNDDSKVAVSQLHIGSEIGLPGLINAGVKVILERVKWETQKESNTGYRSAATNTGWRSAATNTGNQSAATNTGYRSAAIVEGQESVALAMGYQSRAKGALGCWLVLAEWDAAGQHIQDVQLVRVDGDRIQANVWYRLEQGQFVVDGGEELYDNE